MYYYNRDLIIQNTRDISGVLLLAIVLCVFAIVCLVLHFLFPIEKETARDRELNLIVMRCIDPTDQGVSVDQVMEALEDVDTSGFHLSTQDWR